ETVLEEAQRSLRVRAGFHVEANEAAIALRASEHVVHDRDAELLGNVEAHRRELDRDVRVEPPLLNAIEDAQVLAARGARFSLVGHAFAEQVERGANALLVESFD